MGDDERRRRSTTDDQVAQLPQLMRRAPLVRVQVRAADVGGGDADNRVERLLDSRVGYLLDGYVERASIDDGLHSAPALLSFGCSPLGTPPRRTYAPNPMCRLTVAHPAPGCQPAARRGQGPSPQVAGPHREPCTTRDNLRSCRASNALSRGRGVGASYGWS